MRFRILAGLAALIGALSANAGQMPDQVSRLLNGLPVEHKGACNFLPDGSDAPVPCIVLDGTQVWYIIVGTVQNRNFRPVEVKVIKKDDPAHQETLWRDPDSLI